MTDAITIVPGQRIGAWEIFSVDPIKRACCGCACGGVHIFSVEALRDGTAMCSALPISRERAARMRAETVEQGQRREQRRWRPEGRS
jgi:hypothetical protein